MTCQPQTFCTAMLWYWIVTARNSFMLIFNYSQLNFIHHAHYQDADYAFVLHAFVCDCERNRKLMALAYLLVEFSDQLLCCIFLKDWICIYFKLSYFERWIGINLQNTFMLHDYSRYWFRCFCYKNFHYIFTFTHTKRLKLNSTHQFNYRRQIENERFLINSQP